jgi:hypothetical protein
MSTALVSGQLSRRIMDVLAGVLTGLLTFLACGTAAFWFVFVREDVGTIQGRTILPLWTAATRFREWASEHEGQYPPLGETSERLLTASSPDALDPWGRPFRYEVIAPNGAQARVFTLGRDGRPGGTRMDEDIVYWMSASGIGMTWDVRTPPSVWHEPAMCGSGG